MRGKHNPLVPIKQPHRASNGFGEAEVLAMASLMDKLQRGADASRLARTAALGRVAGKFSRMRKLVAGRAGMRRGRRRMAA
jgi:hypothetical protein